MAQGSKATAEFIAPMKALGAATAPPGVWNCEIKFDGYRAVALLNAGRAELWSRNRKAMSEEYPDVIAALEKIRCHDAVLDGEIVALDAQGRSRFQLLQARRLTGARPRIVYYLFDVMQLNGEDLRGHPIERRRSVLQALLKRLRPPLQLSPVFVVAPAVLLDEVRRQGLEGLIAKRPGSCYETDRRSGAWLKVKVVNEQEFVIGGFTPPRRSREYFGALLVGYHERGKLRYAGKVGTGFDRPLLRSLHAALQKKARHACPFSDLPRSHRPRYGRGMTQAEMRSVTWVKPALVAQVRFGEWTDDGLLRQPVFLGLRQDKAPAAVRREPVAAGTKSPPAGR